MIDRAVLERHRNNVSGAGGLRTRDGGRGHLSQAASTLEASSRDDVKPIMLTTRNDYDCSPMRLSACNSARSSNWANRSERNV
jgi:hypothetical protein